MKNENEVDEKSFIRDDFFVSDYLPDGANLEEVSESEKERWREVYAYIHKSNHRGHKWTEADVTNLCEMHLLNRDKVKKAFERVYTERADEYNLDVKTDIFKVELWLSKSWDFMRNEITQVVEQKLKKDRHYEQSDIDSIYRKLLHTGSKFPLDKLRVIMASDFIETYNPFLDYFDALEPWDGSTDPISDLSSYVKTNNDPFFAEQFKKCLVRCIRCGLGEHENRIVFVFVGEKQNTGKSTFIRFLSPFGMKYYTESVIHAKDKDTTFALAENFIYNLEELASLSNLDVNRLKSIISTASINERKPYARETIQVPRRTNFFASTNKLEFLTDTENTRWLIFEVQDIKWGYSTEINIDDVWAQAYALYQDPEFNDQLTKGDMEIREIDNKNYEIEDKEKTMIKSFFQVCQASEGAFYSSVDICTILEEAYPSAKINSYFIGKIMTQLGFLGDRKTINNHKVRGFYAIKIKGNYSTAPKMF